MAKVNSKTVELVGGPWHGERIPWEPGDDGAYLLCEGTLERAEYEPLAPEAPVWHHTGWVDEL